MRVDTQIFNVFRYRQVAHQMRPLRPFTSKSTRQIAAAVTTVALCFNSLYAQEAATEPQVPDPNLVPPQILIDVEPAQANSEVVRITIDSPDYPDTLLRQQLQSLGSYTGYQVRIASITRQVVDASREIVFLKAHVGTNNLIDRATGGLNLEAILKAFAGAPEPYTISSLQVSFSRVTPGESTLSWYVLPDRVVVSGNFIDLPPSIDYRVLLLTQDPDEIVVPMAHQEQVEEVVEEEPRRPFPWLVILFAVIAIAAAGGLVYFVLLNFGRRK